MSSESVAQINGQTSLTVLASILAQSTFFIWLDSSVPPLTCPSRVLTLMYCALSIRLAQFTSVAWVDAGPNATTTHPSRRQPRWDGQDEPTST
jgi:hypothetical protein